MEGAEGRREVGRRSDDVRGRGDVGWKVDGFFEVKEKDEKRRLGELYDV